MVTLIHPEIQTACQFFKSIKLKQAEKIFVSNNCFSQLRICPVLLSTTLLVLGGLYYSLTDLCVCSFSLSWCVWVLATACSLLVFSLDSEFCHQRREKYLLDPESSG